jgi:signal peptidase
VAVLKIVVRILSYICYVIIGIYALICLPMVAGNKPVVVLSGSMRPTYEVGTVIYYKSVPKEEIHENDIITYEMKGTLVTHRVKKIVNGEFVTQGDANNIEDGKAVPYESVQGKVGGLAIPILGFGVQFINAHIWVFVILLAILVAEFLLSNIKSDKISVSEKGRGHEKDE